MKGVRLTLFALCRFVLKGFATDGRDLTDKETKAFLQAADKDGDGKIGAEGKVKGIYRICYLIDIFLASKSLLVLF